LINEQIIVLSEWGILMSSHRKKNPERMQLKVEINYFLIFDGLIIEQIIALSEL
jgi:hypothetical protein